jgi:hypothetical protein
MQSIQGESMSYIGIANKSVSCIYGPFEIKEGIEVPMLYAVKFPQYVKKIDDPVHIVIEVPIIKDPEAELYTKYI